MVWIQRTWTEKLSILVYYFLSNWITTGNIVEFNSINHHNITSKSSNLKQIIYYWEIPNKTQHIKQAINFQQVVWIQRTWTEKLSILVCYFLSNWITIGNIVRFNSINHHNITSKSRNLKQIIYYWKIPNKTQHNISNKQIHL